MVKNQLILFKRNSSVFASYDAAVEALNGLTHAIGQPVIALYTDGDKTKVITAIGKAAATGETSYEILSTDKDVKALLAEVTELAGKLDDHESVIAGEKLGHIKAGGDIEISSEGEVTVPELVNKAPLASPEFTGTPTAPTAAAGTDSTQVATTAFVKKEINDYIAAAQAMSFRGTLGTDGTVTELPEDAERGDTYVAVSGAPDVNGVALEPGDLVIYTGDGIWAAVQTNLDGHIATFNGTTGKVIKDSGVAVEDLATKTTKVMAGEGLVGGGTLENNVTIVHALKPTEGTEAGNEGNYVSAIKVDKFGHIAEVVKSDLPEESGKVKTVSADTADYLGTKFATNNAVDGNELAVEFTTNEANKVVAKVTIDVIDGGTY